VSPGTVFVSGGAVQAAGSESVIYLERTADSELLTFCERGGLAAVIGPRQIGKSSLLIHAMIRLLDRRVRCVFYDLQGKAESTANQLYFDLISEIDSQLQLDSELRKWWKSHDGIDLPERFAQSISEFSFSMPGQPLVLFLDEIDTLLNPLREEFFALIRVVAERSGFTMPVSIVLAGKTNVSELRAAGLSLGSITSFDLPDFSPDQLSRATKALELSPETAGKLNDRVHWWTSGHPYLSMRILADIAEADRPSWTVGDVDIMVEGRFNEHAVNEEQNLSFVQREILVNSSRPSALLEIYEAILENRGVVLNDPDIMAELMLSGLVRQREGRLEVRNRIYAKVLDKAWLQQARSMLSE
jgi:AAA-like domain